MGVGEPWFWRALIVLSIAWAVWVWCAHRPLKPRPTIHVPGRAVQD
jgi:hypothetical protein